jgi:hypothetical protein
MVIPDVAQFNFQSGFGNLNDIADSIGSLFGMGPEDRNSVTAREMGHIEKFTKEVYRSIPLTGIDVAISKFTEKIAERKRHKKKMRSSNSQHAAQLWADTLPTIIKDLRLQKLKSEKVERESINASNNSQNSSVEPNNASMGYFAIALMALYMFSSKNKIKRLIR